MFLGLQLRKKVDLLSVNIESTRLLQVPIELQYSKDIFQHFTIEITKYMFPKPPADLAETERLVNYSIQDLENGTDLQLVILDKSSREFLGCSGLHHLRDRVPELGIWIKKEAQHRGYGPEAIGAIVAWARQHVRFAALKYPVDKRNITSKKIPEGLGGVPVKEYKKMNLGGELLDEIEYWIYY
jgi:ribosomal-protein-alanine N-acetyltransferase